MTSATPSGARSKTTASADGKSASERTRTPVSIRPPCSRTTPASASALDCDPPRATGHPNAWHPLLSAVVKRRRAVRIRPAPREPMALDLERAEERRLGRQWVERRTDVVNQPRNGELSTARAAADRLLGLEHRHVEPGTRQRSGAR